MESILHSNNNGRHIDGHFYAIVDLYRAFRGKTVANVVCIFNIISLKVQYKLTIQQTATLEVNKPIPGNTQLTLCT